VLYKCKYQGITLTYRKLHSRRNWEQIELGECLQPFGPKAFVFHLFRDVGNNVQEFIDDLYGCRTWSVALTEKYGLMVFNINGSTVPTELSRHLLNEDMRRLTTGIRSDFVVRTCTYTNLDSIAYYTPRLYGIAYCC
jgi:hypothetical protein